MLDKEQRPCEAAILEIPPYASILNRKVVLQIEKVPYLSVDEQFLVELMLPLLNKIRVDEIWHLAAYPDLEAAVVFGYREGRYPYPGFHLDTEP
jgi:hypothetical protein